jgi:hypothetical protein
MQYFIMSGMKVRRVDKRAGTVNVNSTANSRTLAVTCCWSCRRCSPDSNSGSNGTNVWYSRCGATTRSAGGGRYERRANLLGICRRRCCGTSAGASTGSGVCDAQPEPGGSCAGPAAACTAAAPPHCPRTATATLNTFQTAANFFQILQKKSDFPPEKAIFCQETVKNANFRTQNAKNAIPPKKRFLLKKGFFGEKRQSHRRQSGTC